ncbi:MAG TPA: YtxH domain-containing protein [Ktedonobacterales bacterium]|nr:YtxH domain-containing protein [Ktedonobacterales bacterium]
MAKNGKRGKSGSGFFWGFVFGLAVGAALAVLFAPQPGEETRQQLAEQSQLLRKRSQLNYDELAATLRERFGDAMVQGREAYARSKDEVLGRYNKAKNAE